ncbi:hypothetical protein [Nonomuraea cavernae]|uniref:Helix-turn-helix DNA binding domain protein n=1 Tax=Nonomuraea cavernae TaxID=2045107 RepID=A0A917YSE9_9ACTN|nr:hypothetical protein [Nonomuraea cavernae]MCA2184676.1 hypothetical protein [Nonomuraea cavernae]GGO63092.1 hypothetical protein GCM10012289_09210 [Nonomuraea cavernae]
MAVEQARRVTAATRQRKAYQLGIKRRVDATRVRQHLQLLRRTMSVTDIAEASTITKTSIWNILLHGQKTVFPETEAKILAVAPINGWVLVDSTGTQRRIQALATMGWTGEEIGRRVARRRGDSWANISRIMQGTRLTASLAAEVNVVYGELCQQVPPTDLAAKRARSRAQRRRWAPPAAWEAVDIDDPDALPDWAAVRCEFVECARPVKPGHCHCEACLKRLQKHGTLDGYSPLKTGQSLIEDALWISEHEGLSLRDEDEAKLIAERLGVTRAALRQGLKRHSAADMQAKELAEGGVQ